ncbi:hypothetical protein K4K54_008754 [Colletotrichum sp. SAR 10_86]|nr:hypothetical protein K4K52_007384 [Colletotrichum sp. SAR 10_76]KAI8220279.1 hypothetical protein K4K54_008754 [Colletotrichum sp. SAR 10_86]KAI8221245.1 hypothetical protein K4K55_011144 [Colletotrichum sp. SAR 10_96]KAI8251162.1 hypothetical protein K4K53_012209 [Colletotrichum sp. SAR 10_77]KAI8262747.1 hypothetical protein K4K58_000428 [Colletotrichum sp. SAR11_239]KAI8282800.1 hypothetical protein K4K56_010932 [Colletotrichum sp. SAR 10_98]KAJ5000166.1 hypothetical protein K4K48_00302
MDAVSSYSFGNLGWLSMQAIPLIIWPRFIGNLLRPDDYQAAATSLEDYFARSLGFALLTLGLLVVCLSGAVPLTSEDQMVLTSLHHASAAFYCYSRYLRSDQTAFVLGCLGSTVFAVFGLYCLMFAGDKSRRSKKGYDKDTSSFPFKNAESYKSKKKGL